VGVDPVPPQELWYFGYGSNVDPRTFLGRRRMRPLETRVGVLEDFALVFDLPVGKGERGMANVRPCSGTRVWGVLYRITLPDAVQLDRSEGVHRGAYRRLSVEVRVEGGVGAARHPAYTLHSDHSRPGRKPSRRYLGLLLAGARHHGLPEEWIAWLRGLEPARDERERQLQLL
jgi:cation transport regulator ChaC